jgi:hypothetical protein
LEQPSPDATDVAVAADDADDGIDVDNSMFATNNNNNGNGGGGGGGGVMSDAAYASLLRRSLTFRVVVVGARGTRLFAFRSAAAAVVAVVSANAPFAGEFSYSGLCSFYSGLCSFTSLITPFFIVVVAVVAVVAIVAVVVAVVAVVSASAPLAGQICLLFFFFFCYYLDSNSRAFSVKLATNDKGTHLHCMHARTHILTHILTQILAHIFTHILTHILTHIPHAVVSYLSLPYSCAPGFPPL